jgi:diguanylate cyclase (GGDEF)-like protein
MHKISQAHAEEFLETMSSDIYHSISGDLQNTITISKTIANDVFLIDMLDNENTLSQDVMADKMSVYTTRMKDTFSCLWVFIVSDQSKAYYSEDGLYRFLDPVNNSDDTWYADFVKSNKEYNVTIGRDSDTPDAWSVFVDVRIENEDGEFLGICGMALDTYDLQEIIDNYEEKYNIEVIFANSEGQIQVQNDDIEDYAFENYNLPNEGKEEKLTVVKKGIGIKPDYTITKYIEEIDWYMIINDFNPYDYTLDYRLIFFNIIIFAACIIITLMALRYIAKRTGKWYTASYQDKLTEIYNRRAYDDDLSKLREQSSLENIIIIALDVNGLKQINDSLGHSAGDELVIESARLIQKIWGPYGKCYRTGGDEFMAVLTKPVDNIDVLAECFEKEMADWHGRKVEHLNISYGIVCASDYQDASIDELVFFADEKMYKKKREYYHAAKNDRRGKRL